jgi:hypothetical protein
VIFTFDDGTEDFGEAGSKESAEFYARVQMGETFPVGISPLLLNAAKADELRQTALNIDARQFRLPGFCSSPVIAAISIVVPGTAPALEVFP